MGSSSRQNRRRNLYHSSAGATKRALKYVERELRRMRHQNGGQGQYCGFRVHPEFGWCHRALQVLGYKLAPQRVGQWSKQRDLLVLGEEEQCTAEWVHVPKRGLVLK